jgi:Lecithin retinol acyltransferase
MQEPLEPGAHLTSPRRGYLHHGIYVGAGRVIHYGGFNRPFRRGPIWLPRFMFGPCAAQAAAIRSGPGSRSRRARR